MLTLQSCFCRTSDLLLLLLTLLQTACLDNRLFELPDRLGIFHSWIFLQFFDQSVAISTCLLSRLGSNEAGDFCPVHPIELPCLKEPILFCWFPRGAAPSCRPLRKFCRLGWLAGAQDLQYGVLLTGQLALEVAEFFGEFDALGHDLFLISCLQLGSDLRPILSMLDETVLEQSLLRDRPLELLRHRRRLRLRYRLDFFQWLFLLTFSLLVPFFDDFQ